MVSSLEQLGCDSFFRSQQPPASGQTPGRVISQQRGQYTVSIGEHSTQAVLAGRLRHQITEREELPAVGDFVDVETHSDGELATIHRVYKRKTLLTRRVAGEAGKPQAIAANVDVFFVMGALDGDFNLRRIERYLTIVRQSQAEGVVLLNKSDLMDSTSEQVALVEAITSGAPVHAVSARAGIAIEAVSERLTPGQTIAFIGSSGVGKSTLVNRLLGEERQAVQEVRKRDARGRHTTTSRELFLAPHGGCIIDTPGMREIQLLEAELGLEKTFPEISQAAERCHYRDCSHSNEAGCQVRMALETGLITGPRYQSYLKLRQETEEFRAYEQLRQTRQANPGRPPPGSSRRPRRRKR